MKDKISFVIALLGIAIALAPFKEFLETTTIDLGFHVFSILNLLYFSLALLFLSVYLYALDYARDGFRILDKLPISKYLQSSGNVLYFIAILFPLIILSTWSLVKFFSLVLLSGIPFLKNLAFENSINVISIFISLISILFSIKAAWRKNNAERVGKEEQLDESAISAVSEAKKLVEKRLWSLSVIEAYRSLELSLDKKMIDIGIGSLHFQNFRAVEVLAQKEILTQEDLREIQFIRELRNKAAHTSIELTETDAEDVLNIVKKLLPKLETTYSKAQSFERNILSILTEKSGIFPAEKFKIQFPSREFGCDAHLKAGNYTYLIEIKFTKNPKSILAAIKQLKVYTQENQRALLIVQAPIKPIETGAKNIRLLYFDADHQKFLNQDEIISWIKE